MNDTSLEFIPLDEIPDDSLILIKVDVPGPMDKMRPAAKIFAMLAQHRDLLAQKRISVLVQTPKESLEIVTEEEMAKAGWLRKEKCNG